MKYVFLKRVKRKITNIFNFPLDFSYLFFNKKVKKNGIILVIHESERLGASLLLLHTAEELVQKGKNIYIISFQFGELNKEYSKIAPTQVVFSRTRFKKTLRKLKLKYGYTQILMVTAATGNYTGIARNLGYFIVSEIHELPSVIEALGLKNATRRMLYYSNKVIFPTTASKDGVLKMLKIKNYKKCVVRRQGIYYKKPTPSIVRKKVEELKYKYPCLKNHNVIIGVGNTSKRKGFDIFVEISKKMPQYIFIWAGKKERYFELVRKHYKYFPNNFIYVGELDDISLAGVYAIASVLLLTSRKDTLPSTLFEAQLFDVPVIASKDSGGVTEVLSQGKNGMLVANNSADNFVNAINQIYDSNNYIRMKEYISKGKYENSFSNYISYILSLYK